LTAHEEYLRLGRNEAARQSAYRELFQAAISSNDLAEIRECTHKGWALGGERFREQVEAAGQTGKRPGLESFGGTVGVTG
jgi:putative transposase